jgi:hypothetical protein
MKGQGNPDRRLMWCEDRPPSQQLAKLTKDRGPGFVDVDIGSHPLGKEVDEATTAFVQHRCVLGGEAIGDTSRVFDCDQREKGLVETLLRA